MAANPGRPATIVHVRPGSSVFLVTALLVAALGLHVLMVAEAAPASAPAPAAHGHADDVAATTTHDAGGHDAHLMLALCLAVLGVAGFAVALVERRRLLVLEDPDPPAVRCAGSPDPPPPRSCARVDDDVVLLV